MGEKKRLVDIDRVKKLMLLAMDLAEMDSMSRDDLIYSLDNAPTEDAVEVVRCQNCLNYTKSKWCNLLMMDVPDDQFCSFGKRRDTENEN